MHELADSEPFDDLEEWSCDIDEFLEGICDLPNDSWQHPNNIGLRAETGLWEYPLELQNSATTYQDAMDSQILSNLEKRFGLFTPTWRR